MDSKITSHTNVAGTVKPQTEWLENNYHVNLGGERSTKEPAQMPNLMHQKVSRKPVVHPKEREAQKKAADKVKAANAKDLRSKNIT